MSMHLLVTLLALGAIVALHELGHLVLARLCGMRVERYSIGFGPILLRAKWGEVEYALSLLPLGGYVKIAGMNPHDGTPADDPRSYANRPAWQRFIVLAAGPFTNYLLAFVVLAALNLVGMPKPLATPIIGEIQPNSPAAAAGLKPDDEFTSVGGHAVHSFDDVIRELQSTQGKPTPVQVSRAGKSLALTVTPQRDGDAWRIQASAKTRLERYPLGQSVLRAAEATALYNLAIVVGLADWIRGRGNVQIGGAVAAVADTMQAAQLGAAIFFEQVAGLSVAVALFNLFPIPALDGGRLAFVLIEMVRRRPVNPRLETTVHAIGLLLLLVLIVVVNLADVRKRLPSMNAAQTAQDAGAPAK